MSIFVNNYLIVGSLLIQVRAVSIFISSGAPSCNIIGVTKLLSVKSLVEPLI